MDLDTTTGISAMKQFHNSSTVYSGYDYDWDQFQAAYGSKFLIYAEGIGLAINSTGVSQSQVSNAMSDLAAKAQGRLPKDHQAYINAIAGKATQINWLDAASTVATDVVVKTVEGAQAVGDSVLTSLSWLVKLLPFLVIGGAVLYVWRLTGSDSEIKASVSKLKDKVKSKIKTHLRKASE